MGAPGDADETPPRTGGRGTFLVATYNVLCARKNRLETACRALDSLGTSIGFLQETKLTGGIYTRSCLGYSILASDAGNTHKGGVDLVWKESNLYEVEEAKVWGPNVITCQIKTRFD